MTDEDEVDHDPDGPWCLDCGEAWTKILPDVRRYKTSESALGVVTYGECRELLGAEHYDESASRRTDVALLSPLTFRLDVVRSPHEYTIHPNF